MAIVEIMGILNFDDDVQFWYTITVLLPIYENKHVRKLPFSLTEHL